MWNILEQPWTLLTVAVISLLIMLMVKNSLPDKYRFLFWFIPLSIAALGLGLDYCIKTDTEQIKAIIKTAVNAVENEQPDVIEPLIADNYKDSMHKSKSDIMEECRFYLRTPFVDKVLYSIKELEIKNDKASILLLNRVFFEEESRYVQYGQLISAEFKIYLTKNSNKQWLVTRGELVSLRGSPMTWETVNTLNDW